MKITKVNTYFVRPRWGFVEIETDAGITGWGEAVLEGHAKAVFSRSYHILIVDRVGGGDSFGGGLIYALSQGYNDQDAINFAVAASCLKHTIEHDFNQVKVEEVLALMNGSGSGRVQR